MIEKFTKLLSFFEKTTKKITNFLVIFATFVGK